MDINKNQQAQDINIDNNPVNKDNNIIPEDKNTDKDIKEEETTPTPVITEEEIKPIEQNNTIEEIPQPTPQPAVKNTVRYIDSGFTF
jgi:hypothetical protein